MDVDEAKRLEEEQRRKEEEDELRKLGEEIEAKRKAKKQKLEAKRKAKKQKLEASKEPAVLYRLKEADRVALSNLQAKVRIWLPSGKKLGLGITDTQNGLLLTDVKPESPAGLARVPFGWIKARLIIGLNEAKIACVDDFKREISACRKDRWIELTVVSRPN